MSEQAGLPMNSGDEKLAGNAAGDLPRDLKALEARIAQLVPQSGRLDRERLMFLAGQASVVSTDPQVSLLGLRFSAKAWPRAFVAMSAVAAALFVMLLTRPSLSDSSLAGHSSVDIDLTVESGRRHFGELGHRQGDVLSVADAHRDDVEDRLAKRESGSREITLDEDLGGQVLTPSSWEQLIH
jgi:hypothetical protein